MQTVYVTACEGVHGGGGFDWFYTEDAAKRNYSAECVDAPDDTVAYYIGAVDVNADSTNDITSEIEEMLEDLKQNALKIHRCQ